MPRGAGLPSLYLTCKSMIPPVPCAPPMPGLCAWIQDAKREKRNKGRKRRDGVRNKRHLQGFWRGRAKRLLSFQRSKPSRLYAQERIYGQKKRAPQGTLFVLEVELPG